MKTYLEDKAVYVKNDDNLVYKVESIETYNGYDSLRLNLVLVCGWDYVNPDENDAQGWCDADHFTEDVQDVQEICCVMEESIKECLEQKGYEILDKHPMRK